MTILEPSEKLPRQFLRASTILGLCLYYTRPLPLLTTILGLCLYYITMQVIASVEKYENAGMKFSTVPAFALGRLLQSPELPMLAASSYSSTKTHNVKVSLFSSPGKFLPSSGAHVATHSLDPRAATRAVPVRNLPAAAHAALL